MKNRIIALVVGIMVLLISNLSAQEIDFPPPVDSLTLVFAGINYGGEQSSPQNYPNARHMTNVTVGSYYFPIVVWETGWSWNIQSLFSYWDDQFKFWSYPDSFTSSGGEDTGRGNICADSKGNLHFAWHQTGSPDGYAIFYSRAILDTSAGVIQYDVERPATMISNTDNEQDYFPAMCLHNDNPFIVWVHGIYEDYNLVMYNCSLDGGVSWQGADTAYNHGAVMAGNWILPSIAADANSGDMWAAMNFDYTGNLQMDLVALHYSASGDTWTVEAAASSPNIDWAYALPSMCVDNLGNPLITFLNIYNPGGVNIWPWPEFGGPKGILSFTWKEDTSWMLPTEVGFAENGPTNARSGFPSAGITESNEVYIVCTQSDSSPPDTATLLPLNIYCWKINPSQGIFTVQRTKVSEMQWGDTEYAIYPHIVYNTSSNPTDGPGISWCQMLYGVQPTDLYYKRVHQLSFVNETENKQIKGLRLSIFPNPFNKVIRIRLSGANADIKGNMEIYNAAGRLVKAVKLETSTYQLGADLVPGIYFLKLNGKPVGKVVKVR